ncbi:MAG: metalloregulator ArsR/SmtB family transcription factor [Planctomycetota bacterium]|nr:metalloregulator ArsR/SmtB family transcription factor [Planctomycetota bacterium]
MEAAVQALAALAQPDRLGVYRLLVRAGSAGLAAGAIARALGLRPQTLTFHLNQLAAAGLVDRRRAGRQRIYALRPEATQALFSFLGEDCCQGRTDLCLPAGAGARARSEALRAKQERPTVLFLCARNSARSQMAEALMRWNAGRRFDVYSAGLRPTDVHPHARAVLEEIGVRTDGLVSTDLGDVLGHIGIDHAIVVCDEADRACRDIQAFARRREFWPIDDPDVEGFDQDQSLASFRAARDVLDERIRAWLRGGIQN